MIETTDGFAQIAKVREKKIIKGFFWTKHFFKLNLILSYCKFCYNVIFSFAKKKKSYKEIHAGNLCVFEEKKTHPVCIGSVFYAARPILTTYAMCSEILKHGNTVLIKFETLVRKFEFP